MIRRAWFYTIYHLDCCADMIECLAAGKTRRVPATSAPVFDYLSGVTKPLASGGLSTVFYAKGDFNQYPMMPLFFHGLAVRSLGEVS